MWCAPEASCVVFKINTVMLLPCRADPSWAEPSPGPDRDSFEVCVCVCVCVCACVCAGRVCAALLSCGLIVYMLSRYQRGRVRACVRVVRCVSLYVRVCVCVWCVCARMWMWIHGPSISTRSYWNDVFFHSQRENWSRDNVSRVSSGPVSAPWPAPRREQKADLHRLMSGTVRFLPPTWKNEE